MLDFFANIAPEDLGVPIAAMLQIAAVVGLAWVIDRRSAKSNAPLRLAAWRMALALALLAPAVSCGMRAASWVLLREPVAAHDAGLVTSLAQDVPAARSEYMVTIVDMPAVDAPRPYARAAWGLGIVVWLAGSAALLLRLSWGLWRLRRLRATMRPAQFSDRALRVLEDVSRTLNLKRMPVVAVSERVASPMALGFFRPAVVFPPNLFESLDAETLRDVLLHECAHLKQRDPLTGLLLRVASALYWPHPCVHFLARGLSAAQEDLCDNHVLCHTPRRAYAGRLVELTAFLAARVTLPGTSGMAGASQTLETRIRNILDHRRSTMTSLAVRPLALLTTCLVAITLFMASLQVKAEEPASPPPNKAEPKPALPDEAWKKELREKLQKHIDLKIENATVPEALEALRSKVDVTVIVDPKAAEGSKNRISIEMHGSEAEFAFEKILSIGNLDYVLKDRAIFVSTKENLQQLVTVVIYDVRDLGDAKALAELIRARVKPDDWNEKAGTSVEARDSRLVVAQLPAVHDLIRAQLRNLRPQKSMQILSRLSVLDAKDAANVLKSLKKNMGDTLTEEDADKLRSDAKCLTDPNLLTNNGGKGDLGIGTAKSYVAGYEDATGKPIKKEITPGMRFEITATVSNDRKYVTVQFQFTCVDLIRIDEKATPQGAIQKPVVIEHRVEPSTITLPDDGRVLLEIPEITTNEKKVGPFYVLLHERVIMLEEAEEKL